MTLKLLYIIKDADDAYRLVTEDRTHDIYEIKNVPAKNILCVFSSTNKTTNELMGFTSYDNIVYLNECFKIDILAANTASFYFENCRILDNLGKVRK